MQEKIIQIKKCKHCDTQFEITDRDLEFYDKVSPTFWWKKFQVPTPTLCSDCRQQRRLSFRNERKLYKRKCDLTWKDIISIYSPDKKLVVYNEEDWWKKEWLALDYYLDFDFSKTFFEQFKQLQKIVPRLWLNVLWNQDCWYINQCWYSKSCYLSYNTDFSENCIYCKNVIRSINCIDCLNVENSQNCYNSIGLNNCFKVIDSQNCKDSSDIFYSMNLINCKNCYWCINLVNKEYCILNKQYTKQQYFEKIENLNIKQEINQLFLSKPRTNNIKNCENCFWDYLENSKNLKHCYECFDDEDIAYCSVVSNWKDIYDFDIWGYDSELNYEMVSSGDKNYNCLFSSNVYWNTSDIYYSDIIHWSKNLFWCIWVYNKEYCILNKQYTKLDYEELVPKIIEHMMKTWEWWEFFPSSLSPFWYNETIAIETYPMKQQDALKQGFNWSTYEQPFPKVEKIIPANKLPNDIKNIPDDILNWAIECEITKRPFKIIKQELDFYRKYNISIPKKHPDERYYDRTKLINPRKLYDRKCDKCWIEIKTTYAPDRSEIVYCEECYEKQVY